MAEHCQNYHLYKKMVQIKVVENEISHKKVNGHSCISPPPPPQRGARELEGLVCFKDYIVLKWESRFIFRLNAAEIPDYIKKLFK